MAGIDIKIFNGDLHRSHERIRLKLTVLCFQESEMYVMYSPELEVTGYGETVKEAGDSLALSIRLFFDHYSSNEAIVIQLKKLGWIADSASKNSAKLLPPPASKLFNKKTVRELFSRRGSSASTSKVKAKEMSVEYPLPA